MFKALVFCGLLISSITSARAAPTHWDFSWSGFFDTLTLRFIDATVSGSFEATDSDADGQMN
ncbi:hypothetical protein [Pseudoduganella sp. R-34]|uniref:hypothetical protein n=1 Tax=unclassified Pseudoduganella TaxID=2637179 RepID=UPI003CEA3818